MWGKRPDGVVPFPDTPYGIRMEAQPGTKVGPLFQCDQPWESAYTMYVSTLLYEDGKYRMWYGRPRTTMSMEARPGPSMWASSSATRNSPMA